jgi:hypothetical protein
MKRLATIAIILMSGSAQAGELGSPVAWISDPTLAAQLLLNNDDYHGAFASNPNHFAINAMFGSSGTVQSIVNTERLIPTRNSGGVTEYAITVGGRYGQSDGSLDRLFYVQVGFGTGVNFVPARDILPGLVFDQPEAVDPIITVSPIGPPVEVLRLLDHQGDTLVFQGSSRSGTTRIEEFAHPSLLRLPLDLPDIPASARGFYSPQQLQGLSPEDIPFTIRVSPVPEPSALALILTGVACAIIGWRRRCWRP